MCLLQRVNSTQLHRSPLLSGAGCTHKHSPIRIQWGLLSRTREKNRLCASTTDFPKLGQGLPQNGGESAVTPRGSSKTPERNHRRRGEKPRPRGDPLPLGASIPIGTTSPTLTAALAARFCAPLSRVAVPLTSLPLRPREGGEGTKSSQPSRPLPPPYRLGGLRPGPALLPTALFPHVGS